ncbi:ribonuclease P protein subunit [Candidatus Bathyarchaeota archaeon]|nr:ribonuclease P protein subunit [Candidatus Bathyarchaeota archaeon]
MAIPKTHEILNHELIGLEAEVLEDSNLSNMCIKGTVIDETMNTLIIKCNGDKRIAKKNAVFKFKLNSEAVKVEGSALQGRPEDRVKKTIKRRW